MKGWRTLAFNVAWIMLTAIVMDTSWIDHIPAKYAAIALIVVNAANIGLRFITTTPVGRDHDHDADHR